jgi:type IV pilus assembly protein PilV
MSGDGIKGAGVISTDQGFSLIEVLVCMLLISVAMLGLLRLQIMMEQKSELAYKSIQALHAVESKLEQFRHRSLDGQGNTQRFSDIVNGADAKNANGITVTWTVSVPTNSLSSATKGITVEGKWTDRRSEEHKVLLQTVISKYSEFD